MFSTQSKYISNSQNAGNCTDSSPKFKNFLGKPKTIISIHFIYSEPTEVHTLFEVDNMNGSLNEHQLVVSYRFQLCSTLLAHQ